jgi:hypothetical protein
MDRIFMTETFWNECYSFAIFCGLFGGAASSVIFMAILGIGICCYLSKSTFTMKGLLLAVFLG